MRVCVSFADDCEGINVVIGESESLKGSIAFAAIEAAIGVHVSLVAGIYGHPIISDASAMARTVFRFPSLVGAGASMQSRFYNIIRIANTKSITEACLILRPVNNRS